MKVSIMVVIYISLFQLVSGDGVQCLIVVREVNVSIGDNVSVGYLVSV